MTFIKHDVICQFHFTYVLRSRIDCENPTLISSIEVTLKLNNVKGGDEDGKGAYGEYYFTFKFEAYPKKEADTFLGPTFGSLPKTSLSVYDKKEKTNIWMGKHDAKIKINKDQVISFKEQYIPDEFKSDSFSVSLIITMWDEDTFSYNDAVATITLFDECIPGEVRQIG